MDGWMDGDGWGKVERMDGWMRFPNKQNIDGISISGLLHIHAFAFASAVQCSIAQCSNIIL